MDAPVNIRRIMERYHDHIWRLKCKVMTGRISGCVTRRWGQCDMMLLGKAYVNAISKTYSMTLSAPLTIISHKCLWLRLIRYLRRAYINSIE